MRGFRLQWQWRVGLTAIGLMAVSWASQATTVTLQTTLGKVEIALFDAAAPRTVANFLGYVNGKAYNSSFFHRSVPGFIIQGGGYTWNEAALSVAKVPASPPVANEFSANRSNLRGTLAMAKIGGNPNSATTEWFVNLADNSANLDNQNGGFTVFGQVIDGMAVVDAIAALPVVNASGVFGNLPVVTPPSGQIHQANLVMVDTASVNNDPDRVFAYLEATYPQYLAPIPAVSTTGFGFYYRYYPNTMAYVGTANGMLYYLGPASGNQVEPLGLMDSWLNTAAQAGY
ncbi:MAG: peptidylprolyl isomerase [Pseudomonadota bacterium]